MFLVVWAVWHVTCYSSGIKLKSGLSPRNPLSLRPTSVTPRRRCPYQGGVGIFFFAADLVYWTAGFTCAWFAHPIARGVSSSSLGWAPVCCMMSCWNFCNSGNE